MGEQMNVPRIASAGMRLCIAGAAVGAVGLLAWIAGVDFLTAVLPGQPRMTPNTALGLVLLGIGGVLRRRQDAGLVARAVSDFAALIALALGAGTLTEYALALDLHIDRSLQAILSSELTGPFPGRPSPPTALAVALLATALLLFELRVGGRSRPAEWLIFIAFFTAFTALVGFAYGAAPLYRLTSTSVTGVSMPTAIGLLLIAAGLLLERPDGGVMRVVTSTRAGGVMLRRLAIPALLGPLLLGPIIMRLLVAIGLQDYALIVAVVSIALTVLTVVLLIVTATPLNRTHEVLEASRARIHDLVEQAPDGIFIADLQGRYTEINGAGCRMLGYSREELLGMSIVDVIPPAEVERLGLEKEQQLRGSTVVSEWILRRKDGTELPVEVSAKILSDGRWQGFVRDISERKRLEREERVLAEVTAALGSTLDYDETLRTLARAMIRQMADVCVVESVEEPGRPPRLEAACRDPGKVPAVEVLQRQLRLNSSFCRDEQALLMSEVDFESVGIDDEQRRALRELGATSFLALPLLAHGGLLGIMLLISAGASRRFDSTDLPLAQEVSARAAWALENARLYRTAVHATQARDELLGIVAHDLRNPLSAIMMQAATLEHAEPTPWLREVAEGIEHSATRMSRLIEDLLELRRLDAGHLPMERARVVVDRLIADCLRTQKPLAAAASVQLTAEVEPGAPDVGADRDRLLQVLENLVGNAIKFTDPGGHIEIGATRAAEEVQFYVSDSGAGIAPEHLPHLFDRFWQVRRTERRGAGLGLAIVKGIVEAHGGRVWAESSPGQGSTFFFTIPLARDPKHELTPVAG